VFIYASLAVIFLAFSCVSSGIYSVYLC